ncbi:ABC transporter ATP-binding protein [Vibrio parahaemolyticus]|uniref:AAA family ATPase n=1 Tax=Vibrio parahaemolyticus TaxID=670 RepID=UPI0006C722C3|nr:AAA family ATPase [Vibrio parahaemolyticus]KON51921.1 ABC transporter ATP-binding protein [Vibrio parahaemolyticus]MCS0034132.1 AAA family ATPase [Vibrio parahaemolyticus]
MAFNIKIPSTGSIQNISVDGGNSVIIVGANGAGKTRLAAFIEESMGEKAHRIAAHRALTLNPSVSKISEKQARIALKTGLNNPKATLNHRKGQRWKDNAPVSLLNDFDFLLQTLFAEQTNTSLSTRKKVRAGDYSDAVATKFEVLTHTWQKLLPHRELHISGDDIQVSITGSDMRYSATDMSDGERAVFYILGQVLVAEASSILIFDEPELHIHKSIMSKLWDELEALRPDCAFVFITHDLEFASSRVADKYVISAYDPSPNWSIEQIPEDTGFDENLVTLILGSRKPILFVEGNSKSLDFATYRSCYPDWTIIPRGSCEQVIHSVVTMRQNETLTRIRCSGLVDADDYSDDDVTYLNSLGIQVIPVSEIENLFLLPAVSKAILQSEGYSGSELTEKFNTYRDAVFTSAKEKHITDVVIRYCKRRIDRTLKKIDLSEVSSVDSLDHVLREKVSTLNVAAIADYKKTAIESAISDQDLIVFLKHFDNKGLLAIAASYLKGCRLSDFEQWLIRALSKQSSSIKTAIGEVLPDLNVN